MAQEKLIRPRVILVMVQSLNSLTTRGTEKEIYTWTSPEDSHLFFQLIATHHVIVMGSQPYEASRSKIKLRPDAIRIVLTHQPAKYAAEVVPGQLEFSAESPRDLLSRLALSGHPEVLLVGGSQVNAAFFDAGLVDELHLTIEPLIFGTGQSLVAGLAHSQVLELQTINQLNSQGTLHLVYRVTPISSHA